MTSASEPPDPDTGQEAAPAALPAHRPERRTHSFLRELPVLIGVAVVLALLIKTLLVQAFYIPSGSMEQTLHLNDRVLVNKVVYHLRDPHRGEIVVFDTKGTFFDGRDADVNPCPKTNALVDGVRAVQRFVGAGGCGDSDFIKRVIAVPGDTVQCCNAAGQVLVNGKALVEKYLYFTTAAPQEAFCAAPPGSLRPAVVGDACADNPAPITVPKGKYWVLGDHRDSSDDSRPNGFVPGHKIVGRAFVRVWPMSRWGLLSAPTSAAKVSADAVVIGATPPVSAGLLLMPLSAGRMFWRRRRCTGRPRSGNRPSRRLVRS